MLQGEDEESKVIFFNTFAFHRCFYSVQPWKKISDVDSVVGSAQRKGKETSDSIWSQPCTRDSAYFFGVSDHNFQNFANLNVYNQHRIKCNTRKTWNLYISKDYLIRAAWPKITLLDLRFCFEIREYIISIHGCNCLLLTICTVSNSNTGKQTRGWGERDLY